MRKVIADYVQEGSKSVNGWFFPPDMLTFNYLNSIQNQLNVTGNFCEVGVFEAKSLVLLSLFCAEGEHVHGFDLFPDDIQDKAQANIDKFGVPKCVTLFAGDTAELSSSQLKEMLGGGLRMLHIDAGHEYHEVFHQMMIFAPFVKEGGIMIMDDYQDREFPGIEAAVLDFCDIDRPRRFVPFFAGGNKMYLCEMQNAAIYQRMLLQQQHLIDACRLTRVRDFNILVGFSKLPVPSVSCLAKIDEADFPKSYALQEGQLADQAARFSQVDFGCK